MHHYLFFHLQGNYKFHLDENFFSTFSIYKLSCLFSSPAVSPYLLMITAGELWINSSPVSCWMKISWAGCACGCHVAASSMPGLFSLTVLMGHIHPFTNSTTHPGIHLSVHPSVHPPTHPPIATSIFSTPFLQAPAHIPSSFSSFFFSLSSHWMLLGFPF